MTSHPQYPPLIESLRNSVCYPHPVWDIRILETHISWVILTGEVAYKIKKPVDFGFLDFSTLDKRKHCCEEELRLNRRLAASLYVDVVPLTGTDLRPRVGGAGDAIDYAVKMWQFDGAFLADELVSRGELTADLLDGLALDLAAFHRQAGRADKAFSFGGAVAAKRAVDENLETVLQRCGADNLVAVRTIQEWAESEWCRLQAEMDSRKAQGWVRECHGDLHLGNLVLWQDRLTPFDGIEFSEDLRWIDVISEVAFLVMDLEVHGFSALAWRFLNTYIGCTGDYLGLRLLRYFLLYRTMVRAKIALLTREQLSDPDDVARYSARFATYLGYGRRCTEAARSMLILTMGLSGSGKSTLARELSVRLPAIQIRSDVERKRLASREGVGSAGLYDSAMTERTYRHLQDIAAELLASGLSVVLDATFLQRCWRKAIADLAASLAVPFIVLRLDARVETLSERIRRRAEAGTDPSDADLAVLQAQLASLEELTPDEERCTVRIDATKAFQIDDVLTRCRDLFEASSQAVVSSS